MGVVAINLVQFYSLLFEVTKKFRKFQKMLRKLLRGSSSQSSQEKQAKEKEKAKYNLPRLAEVRRVNSHARIS